MLFPLVALVASAFAADQQQQSQSQPYYLEKASSAMVNYAVKYRKTDVPEAQASAAAHELVSSALAQPQVTDIVQSAVSYYAQNGPSVNGKQAGQLVSKASSYYDSIHTNPAYIDYTKLVQKKNALFDVDRAVNDIQTVVSNQGTAHNAEAQKVANTVNKYVNALKNDPDGQAAMFDARTLAGKIARDFNINLPKLKSYYHVARARISNLLLRN